MPLFRYQAVGASGKKFSGLIDADSLSIAKEKLRKDKIFITKILPQTKGKKATHLDASGLLAFTRDLSQLLGAGLPLYESLLTIEEKNRKTRAHPLFLDLCDRLRSGEKLSTILQSYPKSFDQIYISLCQAGEQAGSLPWVFSELTGLIERRQKLKKQLLSAVAYPAFLGGFCLLIIVALLLFVIPSMKELFEGRSLHPLTESVLFLSHLLKNHFTFFALIGVLIPIGVIGFFKKKAELFHRFLLKLPLIKTILLESSLIRFSRSAGILLKGGVPLVNALELARKAMKNPPLEMAVAKAEKAITEGHALSEIFKQSPLVPALVTRMLALSEETGQMQEAFTKLSEIYDLEMERNLGQITTFLQPALLLILGGIVGLVILSILLPLTDVSSLL